VLVRRWLRCSSSRASLVVGRCVRRALMLTFLIRVVLNCDDGVVVLAI
jgi:hypothetical protein